MAELKQLRVLRAVADAGSFSGAAERLDYTQPAVSKIVAALEREVGMPLIDRGIRPARLTDAGEALARRADAALEQLAAAELELAAIRELEAGSLRVATFSSAGSSLVVRPCDASAASIRASMSRSSSAACRRWRPPSCAPATSTWRSSSTTPTPGTSPARASSVTPLCDDPMDLVVARSHPLADEARVGFADLAEPGWLMPDFGAASPSGRLLARGCAAAGYEPGSPSGSTTAT